MRMGQAKRVAEKQKPGAVAAATQANSDSRRGEDTRRCGRTQDPAQREFTMTFGQTTIGTILENNRTFTALGRDGFWLGTFATVKEMRAISLAHGGRHA
jgi:hypothetical protein